MSRIAILGCDASGKTVLISSLSDYYKAGSRSGQSCIMMPADSQTRRYTDNLHRVMRINGKWPAATSDISGGTLLKWRMIGRGQTLAELELLDFGGENFRYAFRDDGLKKNSQGVSRLRDYIAEADFVVITVSMDKMLRNLTPALYRELENGDIERQDVGCRAAAAAQPSSAEVPASPSGDSLMRALAEEREQKAASGLMTSLVDSVNKAQLERGRTLIAELSGSRKLTAGQGKVLAYAKGCMDHLEKAQNGNADDMLWIGNQYYAAKDSLGIVKAMFWTGIYFSEGTHGFEKSPATAFKFLTMSRAAGFRNASLDKMIRRVQGEGGGETVDGLYPEDPLQQPASRSAKEEGGHWWGLGIF